MKCLKSLVRGEISCGINWVNQDVYLSQQTVRSRKVSSDKSG